MGCGYSKKYKYQLQEVNEKYASCYNCKTKIYVAPLIELIYDEHMIPFNNDINMFIYNKGQYFCYLLNRYKNGYNFYCRKCSDYYHIKYCELVDFNNTVELNV
jgi:hypothetical protein